MSDNYICISDLQIPFEHEKALLFIKYLKKHYRVPDENMICLGDEVDNFWGGMWKKSPDVTHTPTSELAESRDKLKQWYKSFPQMKVCISNHGTRWIRKACESEIPSQLLRTYSEMIDAPSGWSWHKKILIKTHKPFLAVHGDDWGSQTPHTQAALHLGMSVAMGHHHSKASVTFLQTEQLSVWAAVCGSLIDFDSYAFEYARAAKLKPVLSALVVCNGGRVPLLLPME